MGPRASQKKVPDGSTFRTRLLGGGRGIALKLVLISMVVNAVWDLFARNAFPQAEQVASLLGIVPTGIVIYLLFKRGVDKTLYPEGALGKESPGPPPLPALYEDAAPGETSPERIVPPHSTASLPLQIGGGDDRAEPGRKAHRRNETAPQDQGGFPAAPGHRRDRIDEDRNGGRLHQGRRVRLSHQADGEEPVSIPP